MLVIVHMSRVTFSEGLENPFLKPLMQPLDPCRVCRSSHGKPKIEEARLLSQNRCQCHKEMICHTILAS